MVTKTKVIETEAQTRSELEVISLRPALAEIERTIDYYQQSMCIQATVVAGIQSNGRRKSCYGWFWNDQWRVYRGKATEDGLREETKAHEIMISAEYLDRPAIDLAQFVLHELCHLKDYSLGLHDCSGKRHNKRFKAMAEANGLVCAEPFDNVGHGYTSFRPEYEAQVIGELAPRDEAYYLARILKASTPPKAPTKMRKWECRCSNVRAATEIVAVCRNCESPFIKV